jgi:nucleotide-binding universal stress UspA family protein
MLGRILMPTDGSINSEVPLELAADVARAQDAEVIVARVVDSSLWLGSEEVGPWTAGLYQEMQEAEQRTAREQAERLVTQLRESGVRARHEILSGPVSAALLDLEARAQVGLVVMATHGRRGMARFALGSVADRLVREGTTPVLLVRATGHPIRAPRTALVPLDGSEVAEQALPLAKLLAGHPLEKIRLLRVIVPGDEPAQLSDYLKYLRYQCSGLGVTVIAGTETGDPAVAILRAAAGVDLIIIGTHGRGGFDRFRHGSVADQIVREAQSPVLLVRAIDGAARPTAELGLAATVIAAGGV